MTQRTQSYANHAHRPVLTFVATVFAAIALALFIEESERQSGRLMLGLISLSLAVLVLIAVSRVYIVRLQDRIIRTEMRLRLMALGRDADFALLSMRQLVALRFASDAELPALIDRALAEGLSGTQIKQAINNWQADYHRT